MERAIVAGALANKPHNGGEAWVRLSWVRGLQRLGFDVALVEQIDPVTCVDGAGRPSPPEESVNLDWFDTVTRAFGLSGRAALVESESRVAHGMAWPELLDFADGAAVLVNVSGHLTLREVLHGPRHRAFLDIDPGFTQIWHAAGIDVDRLAGHDSYFTIGENVGRPGCPIPVDGIPWRPTRPPVVLEDWPAAGTTFDRFTTVASWRGAYGPVEHDGRVFGLKAHEFRKVLALPERAGTRFEIALSIHPADARDREALERHGWRLVDPRSVAGDPQAFRRYVAGSGAEFSVAQGIYVDTGSGWTSDRTARYLACGRPAVVQDTGFSRTIAVGEGLLAFRTLEEAAAAAEAVVDDYRRHARAAREVAETWFDSDVVIGAVLADAGVSA